MPLVLSVFMYYACLYMKHIVLSFILIATLFSSCGSNGRSSESRQARLDGRVVTDEGEANPSIMYVQMGEETDTAYQVVFRSYTGAFVNFYVYKKSGTTRMEEYVPTLDVKSEAGTINLFDYIEKEN